MHITVKPISLRVVGIIMHTSMILLDHNSIPNTDNNVITIAVTIIIIIILMIIVILMIIIILIIRQRRWELLYCARNMRCRIIIPCTRPLIKMIECLNSPRHCQGQRAVQLWRSRFRRGRHVERALPRKSQNFPTCVVAALTVLYVCV